MAIIDENETHIVLSSYNIIQAAVHAAILRGVKSVQFSGGQIKNRRICELDDFGIHYIGSLGEVAVARELGINIHDNITVGGDDGTDLLYKGQTIQVKTSSHSELRNERMVILNHISEFRTQWLISCAIKWPVTVIIHGFISKEKFQRKMQIKNFGYGERHCVSVAELTTIKRINEAIQEK